MTTPRWPRSSAWSRTPKAPRCRCSGSPTRSSSVFVPAVILGAARHVRRLGGVRAGDREPDHGHHHHHRGPHHRLPVRPRAGHADRGHGRHRPRRRARHPHLQRRSPRAGPPPHRGRARQDRHHHPRQARPDRRHHRPTAGPTTRCWPGRRGRERQRAPDRPGHRRRTPATAGLTLPPLDGVRGRPRARPRRARRRPPGAGRQRGDDAARRHRRHRPSSRRAAAAAPRGETPMYVAVDGALAAVVTVADTVEARVRRGDRPARRRSGWRCG